MKQITILLNKKNMIVFDHYDFTKEQYELFMKYLLIYK